MSLSFFRRSLLILVLSATGFSQTPARPNTERMEQIIQADVAAKTFMGTVLVARGNDVILSKGYGSANLEWNIPNSPATKFRLGSITKQFTAASVLLLEERGQLSVNDPIKKYLPDAPAAWDNITLHNLLSHTSGIPDFTGFPDYESTKSIATTPAQLIARFQGKPLDFPTGDRFAYSNSNYILLGAVIEKVSGMPYARFLQQNIFTPLGMKDSGYDSPTAVIPQRASGYVLAPRLSANASATPPAPGSPSPSSPAPSSPAPASPASAFNNAPVIDMSIPFAAGGLYSTTEDLLKWQQSLAAGKVINAASFARMTTPVKGGYAYGLNVATTNTGHKMIAHGGGIEGFNTQLLYFPDDQLTVPAASSGLTVIVLSNMNSRAPQILAARLAAVAHGETVTLQSERKAIAVPAKLLADYVGTYKPQGPPITIAITLEGDQLMSQATGQGKLPLFPESPSKFFLKVVDAQIEFFRDASGKVTHLVLYQNGRELKAIKE